MTIEDLKKLLELAENAETNDLASEIFYANYDIKARGRYLQQLIYKRMQGSDWISSTSEK